MIELQQVHRRYAMSGQTVHALAGVDLHIGAGEFVALVGMACGVYPARHAAQLDPIAALRHE